MSCGEGRLLSSVTGGKISLLMCWIHLKCSDRRWRIHSLFYRSSLTLKYQHKGTWRSVLPSAICPKPLLSNVSDLNITMVVAGVKTLIWVISWTVQWVLNGTDKHPEGLLGLWDMKHHSWWRDQLKAFTLSQRSLFIFCFKHWVHLSPLFSTS